MTANDWELEPYEWAASRHDYFDGHAREACAIEHENADAMNGRERRGYIGLRADMAARRADDPYADHNMRYV